MEEFLSAADPSILHFLLASGEEARAPLSSARQLHVLLTGEHEEELEGALIRGCQCPLGHFNEHGQG